MRRVSGVVRTNEISPLLRGLNVIATGARAAPVAGGAPAGRPAASGYASKRRATLEHVGINGQQGLRRAHGQLGAESIGKSLPIKFVRGGALQEATIVVGERTHGAE